MPDRAATTPCLGTCLAQLVLLAACASEPAPFRPGQLDAERAEKCRVVERAYRDEAPEYAALRDELAADPVAAGWLVRMFVRDLFLVREGRPLGKDEELLRAAAKIDDPVEARALAEIRVLGVRAVPTLVGDLLQHSQPQPRELGIELIGIVGAPAVPALRELARDAEPRHRRAAARALGAVGGDGEVLALLGQLAADEDYTVRADAIRGMATGPAVAGERLRAALRDDADPFVRRVAAQALARHGDRASAVALIDYLERCKREGDFPGEKAAQESLKTIAGAKGPRTVAAWRAWVKDVPAAVDAVRR